jgi:hypothetical protein
VIMPDIEKRLEAFVRLGHGIIVFPGGVGTAEEILYLLGPDAAPRQRHAAVPAGAHRAEVLGRLFRADRPVPAPDPGRRRDLALPHHRRRRALVAATDGARA